MEKESRNRLALTLPDDLDTVMERVSKVTGIPKTALALHAIVAAVPDWLAQVKLIHQPAGNQQHKGKTRRR